MPNSSISTRFVVAILVTGGLATCTIAALAWLIPIQVVQSWAVDRAHNDEFSRFEAYEAATATVWLLRIAMTFCATLMAVLGIYRNRVVPTLTHAATEFWRVSALIIVPGSSLRAYGSRLIVVAWLLMAVWQAGTSVQRRLWEWPVYRLLSGQAVLPNISSSNREVIRYVEAATPPGSRILVLSDQKLFFLSYYLLPRRLYHPTHPDSEFVIAQAHNERQLAAYRYDEVPVERIQRVNPDFILEYFEGADFLKGEDLNQDPNWIRFQRGRHGPGWRSLYLVRLRPYGTRGGV